MDAIKVDGMKEAQKTLREFPEKLERKIMRSAVGAAATVARKAAAASAPVATGRLKKRGVASRSFAGTPATGGPSAVIYIRKRQFYGRMVETGTKKMRARPWYLRAIESSAPEATSAMVERVRKNINVAIAKGA